MNCSVIQSSRRKTRDSFLVVERTDYHDQHLCHREFLKPVHPRGDVTKTPCRLSVQLSHLRVLVVEALLNLIDPAVTGWGAGSGERRAKGDRAKEREKEECGGGGGRFRRRAALDNTTRPTGAPISLTQHNAGLAPRGRVPPTALPLSPLTL